MDICESVPERLRTRAYSYELASFQVEDQIYRVPRHGFVEFSEVFDAMFTLPQEGGSGEGQCDDNPIVLPSCTKIEFESLLEVLYPTAPRLRSEPLAKEQWVGVLKLSTMWTMDKIRELSIKELDSLVPDTEERLVLARTYRIPQWLLDGYTALVKQWEKKKWSLDDLSTNFGWETTARLVELAMKAKESHGRGHLVKITTACPSCRRPQGLSYAFTNPIGRLGYKAEMYCLCGHRQPMQFGSGWEEGYVLPSTHLYGDALRTAVEESFKEELKSMQCAPRAAHNDTFFSPATACGSPTLSSIVAPFSCRHLSCQLSCPWASSIRTMLPPIMAKRASAALLSRGTRTLPSLSRSVSGISKAERIRHFVRLDDKPNGAVFGFDEEPHVLSPPRDYGFISLQLGHRFTDIQAERPYTDAVLSDSTEYEIVRKLGWGNEASIWLARRHTSSTKPRPCFVAIKILTAYHSHITIVDNKRFEYQALLSCVRSGDHPGKEFCTLIQDALPYFESKHGSHLCMVFNAYSINLHQYMYHLRRTHREDMSLRGIKKVVKQVVMAASFVHSMKLAHTDIKLDNLFIDMGIRDDEIETLLRTDPSRTYPPRYEPRISAEPIVTVESQPLPLFGNPVPDNLPHLTA
ncbi:hypothetical protein NMY22_g4149 [Coprinellus aureogranulatus]|nr:hypothetical protein NMY22_g4149 [Coprinellus aureogranulatus]